MSISIDVGGTFTDFVVIDDEIKHFKLSSTPVDPARCIKNGIQDLALQGDIFHGTTVATNAIIEKNGVDCAFITNKNFRDILFIGRQTRPKLYDFHPQKPKPPLERKNCYGIGGRIDVAGEIIDELDTKEIHGLAEELKDKDLSPAVCLLHAYADPMHENKIGKIFDEYDLDYSLSSQVSSEYREYERGMTTLLETYLSPLVKNYFKKLRKIFQKDPLIMKSGGGLEISSSVKAVDTIYSGPAGGVAGGKFISDITSCENIVTFDMGGTSADIAAIVDGEIGWKDQGEIGGFPVQSKMVDIVTVGSGGGSIARKDEGGVLRVGPESAGAQPGPVCYGRAGEKPTITDALLLLGYIDPQYFLGGNMDLDLEGARDSIELLSDSLDMSMGETLLGIYRVANSKMARTMKKVTVEKGLHPEDFTILAFGGAGPLHAAYLAEELGMKKVMVPPMPGVFSALGIATGDKVSDQSRSIFCDIEDKETILDEIDNIDVDERKETRTILGLRYRGQSFHINIPFDGDFEETEESFHKEHKKKYGYENRDADIEVVRVHIESIEEIEMKELPFLVEDVKHPEPRDVSFPDGEYRADVYYRSGLKSGYEQEGPAIIEDKNSTILVPPDWNFRVDEYGIIHMEVIG
ncbi:MAG: hydantoinase/oxoprolinase family protein [Thermoplasmatota archaeon]